MLIQSGTTFYRNGQNIDMSPLGSNALFYSNMFKAGETRIGDPNYVPEHMGTEVLRVLRPVRHAYEKLYKCDPPSE